MNGRDIHILVVGVKWYSVESNVLKYNLNLNITTCLLLFFLPLSFSVLKLNQSFAFFSLGDFQGSGETSGDIHTYSEELLLLMELDDLDLTGSWPLDQITFASNFKSPVIFSSSEQPFSPLWSFSEAAGDVGAAELYGAPTRFTDYSVLLASKSPPCFSLSLAMQLLDSSSDNVVVDMLCHLFSLES